MKASTAIVAGGAWKGDGSGEGGVGDLTSSENAALEL
jgi:hypothetical protein